MLSWHNPTAVLPHLKKTEVVTVEAVLNGFWRPSWPILTHVGAVLGHLGSSLGILGPSEAQNEPKLAQAEPKTAQNEPKTTHDEHLDNKSFQESSILICLCPNL